MLSNKLLYEKLVFEKKGFQKIGYGSLCSEKSLNHKEAPIIFSEPLWAMMSHSEIFWTFWALKAHILFCTSIFGAAHPSGEFFRLFTIYGFSKNVVSNHLVFKNLISKNVILKKWILMWFQKKNWFRKSDLKKMVFRKICFRKIWFRKKYFQKTYITRKNLRMYR